MLLFEEKLESLLTKQQRTLVVSEPNVFFRVVFQRMAELWSMDHSVINERENQPAVSIKLRPDSKRPTLLLRLLPTSETKEQNRVTNSRESYASASNIDWLPTRLPRREQPTDPGISKNSTDKSLRGFQKPPVSKSRINQDQRSQTNVSSTLQQIASKLGLSEITLAILAEQNFTRASDLVHLTAEDVDDLKLQMRDALVLKEHLLLQGGRKLADVSEEDPHRLRISEQFAGLDVDADKLTCRPSSLRLENQLRLSAQKMDVLALDEHIEGEGLPYLNSDDLNFLSLLGQNFHLYAPNSADLPRPHANKVEKPVLPPKPNGLSKQPVFKIPVVEDSQSQLNVSPSLQNIAAELGLSEITLNILAKQNFTEESDLAELTNKDVDDLKIQTRDALVLKKYLLRKGTKEPAEVTGDANPQRSRVSAQPDRFDDETKKPPNRSKSMRHLQSRLRLSPWTVDILAKNQFIEKEDLRYLTRNDINSFSLPGRDAAILREHLFPPSSTELPPPYAIELAEPLRNTKPQDSHECGSLLPPTPNVRAVQDSLNQSNATSSLQNIAAELGLSGITLAILAEHQFTKASDLVYLSEKDVDGLRLPVRDALVLKDYLSLKEKRHTAVIADNAELQRLAESQQPARLKEDTKNLANFSKSMECLKIQLNLSPRTMNILTENNYLEEEDLRRLDKDDLKSLSLPNKDTVTLREYLFPPISADEPPNYAEVSNLNSGSQNFRIPNRGKYKILLIGETGSGKSTLINYFANFFLKGTLDNLRIEIPTKYCQSTETNRHSENNLKDSTVSQTSNCLVYKYSIGNAKFEFIDTPGLSDTSGTDKDDKNISKIMEAASKAGKLSAIIIVINGSVSRKTANLANTIQRMKGSLPDVVLNNLIVVLTNTTRATANFQIDTLKPWVIQEENIFFTNNSALSKNPSIWRGDSRLLQQITRDWEESMNEIQSMITRACELGRSTTEAFQTMKEKQDMITAELVGTMMEIKNLHKVQDKLDATKKAQTGNADDLKKYSKFTKKTEVEVTKLVDCEYHSTMCQKHSDKLICHEKCGLNETVAVGDQYFKSCLCMRGGSHCTVCECGVETHFHAKKKLVKEKETVEEIMHDIKAQFELSTKKQTSLTHDIATFENDMQALKAALAVKEKTIENCCKQLQAICKEYNFVALMTTNISMMETNAQAIATVEAKQEADAMIRRIKELVNRLKSGTQGQQGYSSVDKGTYSNNYTSGGQTSQTRQISSVAEESSKL